MNLIVITGNLCKDIEIRRTQSGKGVVSNCVGVQRDFKENGEYKTDFVNIVVWGSQAEYLRDYGAKGDRVEVMGRLQNRQYQAQDGTNKNVSEVIVEKIKLLKKQPKNDTSNDYEVEATELTDSELPF